MFWNVLIRLVDKTQRSSIPNMYEIMTLYEKKIDWT